MSLGTDFVMVRDGGHHSFSYISAEPWIRFNAPTNITSSLSVPSDHYCVTPERLPLNVGAYPTPSRQGGGSFENCHRCLSAVWGEFWLPNSRASPPASYPVLQLHRWYCAHVKVSLIFFCDVSSYLIFSIIICSSFDLCP